MKTIEQIRIQPRLCITQEGPDGGVAWAELTATIRPDRAIIIFSWGGGWDHVSVSFRRRTPTWDEMCEIKRMFFRADETVLQFHPREEEYINQHPYCLHLWKKQGQEPELPPWWMLGLKKGKTLADIPASAFADNPVLAPGA